MKKIKGIILLFIASFVLFLLRNNPFYVDASSDFSNETSITYANLYNQIIANNGSAVSMKDMEINMLQGNVYGEIKGFANYSNVMSDNTNFSETTAAGFNSWRIKATTDSSAIFEVKATNDIKLSIGHTACKPNAQGIYNGDFLYNTNTSEYGSNIKIYYKTENGIFEQWNSGEIKNPADVTADLYGGDVMLKAGEICYFTFNFETTAKGMRIISALPNFISSVEGYSESIRKTQIKPIESTTKEPDKSWKLFT